MKKQEVGDILKHNTKKLKELPEKPEKPLLISPVEVTSYWLDAKKEYIEAYKNLKNNLSRFSNYYLSQKLRPKEHEQPTFSPAPLSQEASGSSGKLSW